MKSCHLLNGSLHRFHPIFSALTLILGLGLSALQAGLPEGWRFVQAQPHGNDIHAAWAAGPNDLYTGGEGGMIWHWDGTSWAAMETPTQKTIFSMHGLSATDIWAVGGDSYAADPGDYSLILHYDGDDWTEMTPPDFIGQTYVINSVHAIAEDDVWATLDMGTQPIHFDGDTWQFVNPIYQEFPWPEGSFQGVGSVDADHVFFFGTNGQIVHKDGDDWIVEQKVEEGNFSVNILNVIWAPALDSVYVGGNWGQLYRRNADGSWTDLMMSGGISEGYGMNAIWGRSPTEIYLLAGSNIRRWDGHFDGENIPSFDVFQYRTSIRSYWKSGAHTDENLFAVGANGAVHEFVPSGDSGILSALTVGGSEVPYSQINGVTPFEAETLIGWGTTTYSDGWPLFIIAEEGMIPFTPLPPKMQQKTRIPVAKAFSPDNVVVCWNNAPQPWGGVSRWNGTEWTEAGEGGVYPPAESVDLWTSPGGTLYACESHRILKVNEAGEWEVLRQIPLEEQADIRFSCVGGLSDSELFVGTEQGNILRYDGAQWSDDTTPEGARINAILNTSSELYAVGDNSVAWRRSGNQWTALSGIGDPRDGDNFTHIAEGNAGILALQQTPAQYIGGGLGRVWQLEGGTATRIIAGLSDTEPKLTTSGDGHFYVVGIRRDFILTDRPLPDGFTLQRLDTSSTDWSALGDTGVELKPASPGLGSPVVTAWRVDEASSHLPAEMVGDGTAAQQRWVIQTEESRTGGIQDLLVRLQYDPALIPPNSPTDDAVLFRYDGAEWVSVEADIDPINHWITSTSPTGLSEWTFTLVEESAPPSLRIAPGETGSLLVAWPESATGFQLQSTPALGNQASWTDVDESGEIIGEDKVVAIPVESAPQFFRLVK